MKRVLQASIVSSTKLDFEAVISRGIHMASLADDDPIAYTHLS
jgi:hypothetical protein